jgi:hypothetical protein
VKCFWCYRLFEDGKLAFTEIKDAEIVYGGDSMCIGHLDAVRREGGTTVLAEGLTS